MKANKTGETPKPLRSRTEEEILAELGFKPDHDKVKEQPPQLGTLYRRFLHGSDLGDQAVKVEILNITKEKVMPHPALPLTEKWCLWVSGLPQGMPNGILFGTRGEEDLIAIFGKVSLEVLKGKAVLVYPKPTNVGGQQKASIHFRRAE